MDDTTSNKRRYCLRAISYHWTTRGCHSQTHREEHDKNPQLNQPLEPIRSQYPAAIRKILQALPQSKAAAGGFLVVVSGKVCSWQGLPVIGRERAQGVLRPCKHNKNTSGCDEVSNRKILQYSGYTPGGVLIPCW